MEVKVSRSTRISFECHPSVLLEDLLFDNAMQDFGQDVLSMFGDDDEQAALILASRLSLKQESDEESSLNQSEDDEEDDVGPAGPWAPMKLG